MPTGKPEQVTYAIYGSAPCPEANRIFSEEPFMLGQHPKVPDDKLFELIQIVSWSQSL